MGRMRERSSRRIRLDDDRIASTGAVHAFLPRVLGEGGAAVMDELIARRPGGRLYADGRQGVRRSSPTSHRVVLRTSAREVGRGFG